MRPSSVFPKQNETDLHTNYNVNPEPIGKGAYGVVRVGNCNTANKPYAIKSLAKQHTRFEDMHNELTVMALLNHPNIVEYKEMYEKGDEYHIVMEYITGGELLDKIMDLSVYTEQYASHVMKQLLEGLGHMHKKGIAHLDIKPENILLSNKEDDAIIKLADFGIATDTKFDDRFVKELIGTMHYISPEASVCRNNYHGSVFGFGCANDIWAAGVVLYILLSGQHPFYQEDEDAMLETIERGQFTWLGDNWGHISESAKDLIRKMLEKDIKTRLTAEQCLEHEWFNRTTVENVVIPNDVSDQIRKFQARKRMKKAIRSALFTNRLKNLTVSKESVKKYNEENQ
jgi:serine/threonine protein kinase